MDQKAAEMKCKPLGAVQIVTSSQSKSLESHSVIKVD